MASEIRVNTINNRSGLGTISITDSGASFSGVVTATNGFSGNLTGNVTGDATGLSGSPTLSGITSVSTTNLTVNGNAYPATGPLSNRNLIINGAMTIDQRNNGASVTDNASYPVDRFIMGDNATGLDISSQRSGISPVGFTSSLSVSVVTAATPGTNESGAFFYQVIEGYNFSPLNFGSSDAKSFTLSFYVRSSVTGTYSCGFRDGGGNVSYTADYTISSANTWEYKTITVPGETSGSYTWNTTNGGALVVSWGLGNGSGRSAAPGSWAAGNNLASTNQVTWCNNSGATFYLTGVQLEVGSVATPFEHRNIGDELARCQRYYCKSYSYQDAPGTNTSDSIQGLRNWDSSGRTDVPANVRFPVEMRAAPTVKIYTRSGTIDNTSESSDGFTHAANRAVSAVRAVGRAGYSTLSHSASIGGLQFYIWHWTASAEI